MDLLKELLSEKGANWIHLLVEKADMQQGQAESFLPAAAQAVAAVLQGGKLDLGALLGGGGMGALLAQLDLGALAAAAGVDASTASAGVEQVGPELLSAMRDRAGGLDSLLGALGDGEGGAADLLGTAGSLGKKLFG
jgi:ribose 5-phosphate isomerase RpiB